MDTKKGSKLMNNYAVIKLYAKNLTKVHIDSLTPKVQNEHYTIVVDKKQGLFNVDMVERRFN